ncbi:hypothetical protein R1flu_020111 [Riccia fluitans]|uniref:Uncharacterized protein n=1 Tax=Riccia fluitans TaxID=41844 RepID=A0ABD1ZKL7_9MARC
MGRLKVLQVEEPELRNYQAHSCHIFHWAGVPYCQDGMTPFGGFGARGRGVLSGPDDGQGLEAAIWRSA